MVIVVKVVGIVRAIETIVIIPILAITVIMHKPPGNFSRFGSTLAVENLTNQLRVRGARGGRSLGIPTCNI